MRNVYVLGAGMHPFGKFPDKHHVQIVAHAANNALADAGVRWRDIQGISSTIALFCGGISHGMHGNELAQVVAESGIPIANVAAACASGGAAVNMAYMMIASGQCDIALAVGGEKMPEGFIARPPLGATNDISDIDYAHRVVGISNPAYWAMECRRRMEDYGTTPLTLAKVSEQAHRIAVSNPLARYHKAFTAEEIMASPMVADPLHLYEVCAVSDGAAAVVLGSEDALKRLGKQPIRIAASVLGSSVYGDTAIRVAYMSAPVKQTTRYSSEVSGPVWKAYEMAGISPKDVDFMEIADNCVWQALAWPELFGQFEPGEADSAFERGETDINGRMCINPSGGFLSFGEATGAMGVFQVCELTWQLRGNVKDRQVPNAKVGLAVALGEAGVGAATILTN